LAPKPSSRSTQNKVSRLSLCSPSWHPSLEFNFAVSDTVTKLSVETGASDGREDGSGRRVTGPDAIWSSRVGRRASAGEVESVSVDDLLMSEEVRCQGWNDVEGVVLDESVGVVVSRPVKLAVTRRSVRVKTRLEVKAGIISVLLGLRDAELTRNRRC